MMKTEFKHLLVPTLWIATVLSLCLPAPAAAQLRMEDVTFRASAGTTLPVGPSGFSDGHSMGLAAGLGVGVNVTPILSLTLEGRYVRFGLTSDGAEADVLGFGRPLPTTYEGGAMNLRSAGFALRYLLSESRGLQPYLAGSLTAQRWTRERVFLGAEEIPGQEVRERPPPPEEKETQAAFGVSFGLGLRLPVSYTAAFFAEPRYAISFTAGERLHTVPVRIGFVFGDF